MSIGTSRPQGEYTDQGTSRRWGRRRPWARATVALAMAAGLTTGSFMTVGPAGAATRQAQSAPALLEALTVAGHGKVLVNSHHFSLYGYSPESAGKIVCKAICLKFWPPVLVSSKVTSVSVGAGVSGKVGFVKRSATTKQVTFNGWPLYTFIKDKAPAKATGEGVKNGTFIWGLIRASATTPAATLILPAKM